MEQNYIEKSDREKPNFAKMPNIPNSNPYYHFRIYGKNCVTFLIKIQARIDIVLKILCKHNCLIKFMIIFMIIKIMKL